jgi:hypothetical protein
MRVFKNLEHNLESIKCLGFFRIVNILIYILLSISFANAQVNTFNLISTINVDAKEIQTDRMGNLYIISKTNQLYKYSSSGKLLSTLNYNYSGNITSLDVSNTLEIYVFYRELNSIVFLDNNLAFRGDINLSNFGIGQASSIARSYDNGIWIFDVVDLQVKKLGKDGVISLQSNNVRQFTQAKSIMPTFMFDNNDRLYVNDSTLGILVFDVFTNYIKTIPIKGIVDFKILGDDLYFSKNQVLYGYKLKGLLQKSVQLPDNISFSDCSIEKDRLFIANNNLVEIYEVR